MFKPFLMKLQRWMQTLKRLWEPSLAHHEHGESTQQEKLERAFMHTMIQSQKLVLRELREILSRLPAKQPTHMELEFGSPES